MSGHLQRSIHHAVASPAVVPCKLTDDFPQVAFTFRLLKHFHLAQCEMPCGAASYYDTLALFTDAVNGRLREYKAKVRINLQEDAKPVLLAPYSASPAKRETIDAQMDLWLSLGVIEPSESPWGFPVLIVYRNNKARTCIDYRKLNAMTIPDEYPLPKQSDIIQLLTGSQWLSSLDALAGLEIVDKDRPKTAFRSHRGLYQFRHMPFGLRNGPAIFQRVMQNVLAPYLWMFALVYVDDIIIYSKTFEEHLKHLDAVLSAIAKANLTLAPAKCHLAYQSLLLLGQKVSRLGMSTCYGSALSLITPFFSPSKSVAP